MALNILIFGLESKVGLRYLKPDCIKDRPIIVLKDKTVLSLKVK